MSSNQRHRSWRTECVIHAETGIARHPMGVVAPIIGDEVVIDVTRYAGTRPAALCQVDPHRTGISRMTLAECRIYLTDIAEGGHLCVADDQGVEIGRVEHVLED